MTTKRLTVKVVLDTEYSVWFVDYSSVPGLTIEDRELESLLKRIPGALQDLLKGETLGDDEEIDLDILVEGFIRGDKR